MVQIDFINIKEISVSNGFVALHKKKSNFNKLIDNKPGAYSVEFIQPDNPSNKDRLKNRKVSFASVVS